VRWTLCLIASISLVTSCGWTAEHPATSSASRTASPTPSAADRERGLAVCEGWRTEIKSSQGLVSALEAGKGVSTQSADFAVLSPAAAIVSLAQIAPASLRPDLLASAAATKALGEKLKAWHGGPLDVRVEVPAFDTATAAVTADCGSLAPLPGSPTSEAPGSPDGND
jgi:hypothetical protein